MPTIPANSFARENPYAGIGDAPVFERGEYIMAGDYTLTVVDTIHKETQDSGPAFIAEFSIDEVFSTSHPETHYVGAKVTYFQKVSNKALSLPYLKEFAVAALGVTTKDRGALEKVSQKLDAILYATTSGEPVGNIPGKVLVGRKVRCRAVDAVSKKGNDITRLTWSPVA